MATTVIDDGLPVAVPDSGSPLRTQRSGENRAGWLLSAPFIVFYLIFLIGPALYGILMSFFNTTSVKSGLGAAVGLANYREVLTSSAFWGSMGHTLWFTVLTTPPLVILAFVFAILAERIRRGRALVRFIFFAPFVMPVTSVTMIFGWLFTAQIGLFPKWLSDIGISPPNFLGTTGWSFITVALLTVWWTVGFNFVLFLAGLQEIPTEVYEAAAIDGSTPRKTMWSITMPLLRPTIVLVTMLQILASLQIFNQMYLMTGGGPGTSTRPVMEFIYDYGFSDYRAGYAAAATMVYFVIVLVVSLVWFVLRRQTRKTVGA
ncbi:carbohydrate ABC transporter permease [Flexivirga caeni]|uniref:Sugar ABC transporter permease n=1 Tax=Flexivirga caeni TaxID=2294115 RepID=A0A3M9MB42_9MICO|nr:sugar ABC transporter permease [Flexivirga caeni]RNI22782.1 sugar ABC transporter permease [Flexivirga caeni]